MTVEDYHDLTIWGDIEKLGKTGHMEREVNMTDPNDVKKELDQKIHDVISKMFEALETPNEELTEWEDNFVSSVRGQFNARGSLSVKQREILERIYAEKTP